MYSIAGLLMVGFALSAGRIYKFRHEASMEKANLDLLYVIVFGSIVACITVFLIPGEPSSTTCFGPLSTGCIGFTLVFGTLLLRTHRIYLEMNVAVAADDHVAQPESRQRAVLFAMLGIDVILLISYFFVLNPGKEVITKIVPGVGPVDLLQCKGAGFSSAVWAYQIWPILFLAYKGSVAVALYYFAFETRLVPNVFNEPAVTFIIAHVLCGLVIIIGVVIWRLDSNALVRYVLTSVGIFATTLTAVFGLVGLKLMLMARIKSATRSYQGISKTSARGGLRDKILVEVCGDTERESLKETSKEQSARRSVQSTNSASSVGGSPSAKRASSRTDDNRKACVMFDRIATDKNAGISHDDLQRYVDAQFEKRAQVTPLRPILCL